MAFSSPTMLAPLSGRMRMQDGKRTVWLGPEQIVLLRPGHSVTICADKNESPPVCRLSFESYRLAEHDDEQLVYRNDRSCLPASGWVTNRLPYRANVLLNELLHACQQASAHGQTAEQKQHQRLFKELMELALQYEITPELDWEPSIQKAVTYIEENYRSPITRSELARLAGFHTSYFSTLFAKKLGWGYSEYLNRVRIDRAKEHLLTSAMTVNGAYDDEQLANLKADLVLAPTYFYYTPGRMKRLQNIAPVLALEWDKLDPLAELRLVGKLIGREREAERWIERYQAQVETARKQLQKLIDRGDTAAVYELRHDGVFIWNKTARGAYNLYDALGFRPPESVHRDVLVPGRHLWIAADRLPEYAADHMFVIDARDDHGAGVHGLSLPAFEKAPGQVYALELNEFWSSDGLALERQLHIQTNCLLRGGAE
ncbi:AraC family transcriptional regulator [Brevibacillus agri]|uniref:AraC family transcriptional regulator n=1 Tax=Brevibacillus agri TaxID=51101 RepID=UPI002E2370BD|nr:AraC family transcriptional regulator [Brevibacillus agri]MED1657128.1 AraC family transcriptional regulator [Brevibacillus agri]MED1688895.1 AraC family transcriptional regulator [Brevibacillus agri]MED1693663.1 AraC family transcriptional regulator [Brevibacillus agri]MED1698731.1 AraC family transcriptional regulator [Brevibacillus agri]